MACIRSIRSATKELVKAGANVGIASTVLKLCHP